MSESGQPGAGGSQRSAAREPGLDQLARALLAAAGAAVWFALSDGVARSAYRFAWLDHFMGAVLLCGAAAGALGVLLFLWGRLEALIGKLIPAEAASSRSHLGVLLLLRCACLAALTASPAQAAFSGNAVSRTVFGRLGPPLLVGSILAAMLLASLALERTRDRRPARIGLLGALVCFGSGLIWLDLTVYPFLYPELHGLIEGITALVLVSAGLIGLDLLRPAAVGDLPRSTRWGAFLLLPLSLGFLTLPDVRAHTDELLAHTWLEEHYLGRQVRRIQEHQARVRGYADLDMARRAELLQRFGIEDSSLDPRWLETVAASPRHAALHGVENIAIFYVDTLREDVTRDARLMPRLAQFRAESLDFLRAYAPGSDTLRSLPALTGGNHFVLATHPGDLIRLARSGGRDSALVAPSSARAFLRKLHPEFAFQREIAIADHDSSQQVWGYGADRPTAAAIVGAAKSYLQTARSPFLLWMFHFDQHAWRELDQGHIDRLMARHDVDPNGSVHVRYRAVAADIDAQFGRFLDELERTGHDRDTAVLFVSDHGEGLGQEGFWVHSVFLWESLIHVPLVLRIPGLPGRQVEAPVSLVDVAPTLAPILDAGPAIYHGEDLLRLATEEGEAAFTRRLPILLRSATNDRLSRMGLIEPHARLKFVMRIQALFPELYLLDEDPGDTNNLAGSEPQRVAELLALIARSPVFPRTSADFRMLESAGELQPLPAPPGVQHVTLAPDSQPGYDETSLEP